MLAQWIPGMMLHEQAGVLFQTLFACISSFLLLPGEPALLVCYSADG
jgi:hypothetical protein